MTRKLCFLLTLMGWALSANALEWNSWQAIRIACDTTQVEPVVKTALSMFAGDCQQVLNAKVGIGKTGNVVVEQDAAALGGKKEAFRLRVKNEKLYITGSDARGLAYGILQVSRLMGVSPWEWWADATPAKLPTFSLPEGYTDVQSPTVEFRGLAITAEDGGLLAWSNQTYEPTDEAGQIGPKTTERIFQLLLRLRANTYWAPSQAEAVPFFKTKGNREVARRYGILICETADEASAAKPASMTDPLMVVPGKDRLEAYDVRNSLADDACLLWSDDGMGYVSHYPAQSERQYKGGNGIVYHLTHCGQPHDNLWLGSTTPALLFQQLATAYRQGIQRMWMLSTGNIKPSEYQVELFMDMAWNLKAVEQKGADRHLQDFLQREFGEQMGQRLLPLMQAHYRLAYVRKPELLGNNLSTGDASQRAIGDLPWSTAEIDKRLKAYQQLEDDAEACFKMMLQDKQDNYYQLVKYPLQATSQMNKKLLWAQKARHGLASWLKSDRAYDSIQVLTRIYSTGFRNQGKWMQMVDCQPRRLPVFQPVVHKQATDATPLRGSLLLTLNATDSKQATATLCKGLGYEGKAAELGKGKSLIFEFKDLQTDSIDVEVCLLPCQPTDGNELRLAVTLDKMASPVADFAAQPGTADWQENVVRNQAICRYRFPFDRRKSHQLVLTALDEGIVVDQVLLRKP